MDKLGLTKDKVNDLVNNFKQTASETFKKVEASIQNSENTKNVQSSVSSFFSGALNKLKNAFGSKTNADDLNKQEAIKAFDDYAQKHSK